MTDKTDRTIEVLEDLENQLGLDYNDLSDHGHECKYKNEQLDLLHKQQEALTHIIQLCEAHKKAENVLPEKKEPYNDPMHAGATIRAYNKAIDICTPIYAKLIQENEELMKAIESLIPPLVFGSEFVKNPERCIRYAKQEMKDRQKYLKETVKLRKEIEGLKGEK